MNEVCRARVTSSSKSNVASLVKICRSGQNRTRVPVTPFLHPAALAGQARPRRRTPAVGPVAVEDARARRAGSDIALASPASGRPRRRAAPRAR